jgi:FkbM family methyltransferase
MLATLISRLLRLAPPSLLDRIRRRATLAHALNNAASFVLRPLEGEVLTIERGEAAGLRLRAMADAPIWLSGNVERPVQALLRRVLRPGDVFFDVGAGIGFFTIIAARLVGGSGTVVAFEPDARSIDALHTNVNVNDFVNVVVVPKAVSAAPGSARLEGRSSALSTLVDVSAGPATAPRVATTSVDAFVAASPELAPRLVKIDVEGHEVEVLRGMATTLSQHTPIIVCEMHGANAEVNALLRDAGYTVRPLEDDRPPNDVPPGAHVVAFRNWLG